MAPTEVENPEEDSMEMNDKVVPRVIEEEMKIAYITYAMSVIVGRALPDVRDGLKPVHRRILYAMHEEGMTFSKPFKKCARIVGNCMGRYHPHGDSSVYDALVRMAQDFSLRYPLIKGQGNFGSIDGDSAAAMRYTESKLNKLAEEMLKNIDKNTVDFKPNFDGSLKEPIVLPNVVPNLLINGSSGIAVGMATNIPPHNLTEVCNGAISMIDNPEITTEELMEIIPAPDFPTGGEVICGSALHFAYAKGRGKVYIKAISDVEEDKIIIHEIPYQVNKEDLIKHIAELVRDKVVEGIRNINDESDREGIRIVIDLKRGVDSQVVLNQLYKYSRLKISFGINLLALVNGEPKLLGLKDMLQYHIDHRKEVIIRRTTYDLEQAEQRIHILDGLLIALNNLDEVIPGIRKSNTVDEAKEFLMGNYSLSEIQAKAILEMRLQKLASLEQEKIRSEHKDILEKIIYFKDLLGSVEKILSLIKEELKGLIESYGDARRSTIVIGEDDDVDIEELIEEETVVVTMTNSGYLKRLPLDTYKTQRRGGKGVKAAGTKEEDFVENLYVASTHDYLMYFTDRGQVYWLKVYHIPVGSRISKGKHVRNLLQMEAEEKINAVIPVRTFEEGYLFMATQKGVVKKTELQDFSRPRKGGIRAISLDEDDTLVNVRLTTGDKEIIIATQMGSANRFNESDVRHMGRTARGVRGIRLRKDDEVIGMLSADEGMNILTITEKGYGKRTPVSEYRLCKRGGKGVTNIKITEKNGLVKTVMLVDGSEELMLISKNGIGIRMKCSDISLIGRSTQGVRVIRLNEGDELAASAKIILEDEELGEDGLPVEKEVAESSEQTPVNNLDDEESLNVGEGESKDSNDGDLSDSQEDDNKVDDEKLDDENNSENEDDSNEKLENDNLSEESVSGSEDDLADEPEDRKEE
jgi:DNA gyrase subunit A